MKGSTYRISLLKYKHMEKHILTNIDERMLEIVYDAIFSLTIEDTPAWVKKVFRFFSLFYGELKWQTKIQTNRFRAQNQYKLMLK